MAYTDVPVSINETFSESQPKIKANFLAIKASVEIDHVAFDDGDQGKHKKLTMPEQTGDATTLANEKAMYSKQSALSGVAELFIRNESDGTVTEFTSALKDQNGWTRLPSGILLKWGSEAAAGGSGTYAFPVAATIPVFAHIYQVIICPNGDGGSGAYDYMPYITAISITGISIYGSARTVNDARANCHYRYLAIGD